MKTRGRSFLHPPFPRPASGRISTSLGIDISGRRELNHLSFECWRPRYQARTAAGRGMRRRRAIRRQGGGRQVYLGSYLPTSVPPPAGLVPKKPTPLR